MKETSIVDNNLRRGQPLALPVAQTFMKIEGSFFKQIFLPYVPVYDKTKKEIVSLSAGKSVDMTDLKQGHDIVNYNLTILWNRKQVQSLPTRLNDQTNLCKLQS